MEPPTDDIDLKPEKLEEEKESGPLFQCDLFDTDMVYKIGQSLLPGLATTCIDNTIGSFFKTPASVAVDIRKEMIDYLTQRSESFMAESVVLEGGPEVDISVDPYDTISDFVDDFVNSKRSFFSRVSGWIMSEKREDWIDDLVQEMELNGFWLSSQRNSVGQNLLKNLDFKNTYHCNMSFKVQEDLEKHKMACGFRTMTCESEGCDSSFSAAQFDHHDSVCPFKILPCEQNCPDSIMRREMDRHCITVCQMKLVKCPFHSLGCKITIPQCTIGKHRTDSVYDHLLYMLRVFHKEASEEDLKERVKELEKLSSLEELASTRDVRSLTNVVKSLEARLGPLKVSTKAEENEGDTDFVDDKKEETPGSPKKHIGFENHPSEKEDVSVVSSHSEVSDHQLVESSTHVSSHSESSEEMVDESASVQEEKPKESPEDLGSPTRNVGEVMEMLSKEENLNESPFEKEEDSSSPTEKVDTQIEKLSKEDDLKDLVIENKEDLGSPAKRVDEQMENMSKEENSKESPFESKKVDTRIEKLSMEDDLKDLPIEKKEDLGSPAKSVDEQIENLLKEETSKESQFETKEEDLVSPTKEGDEHMESLSNEENMMESPFVNKEDNLVPPSEKVDELMDTLLKEENVEESPFEKKEDGSEHSPFEKKEDSKESPPEKIEDLKESPSEKIEDSKESPSEKIEDLKEPFFEKKEDLKESLHEKKEED